MSVSRVMSKGRDGLVVGWSGGVALAGVVEEAEEACGMRENS